jgi:hypothetical protein
MRKSYVLTEAQLHFGWLKPQFPFFLIKTPVIAHSRAPRDTRTDGCIERYLNWTLGYQKSKKVTITNSDKKNS